MKVKSEREVTQLCPTPSGPMDRSLAGASVHGIFQARVLEWVAIAFSAESHSLMEQSDCSEYYVKYYGRNITSSFGTIEKRMSCLRP